VETISSGQTLTATGALGGDEHASSWPGAATVAAFAHAVRSGRLDLPLPGSGQTRVRWVVLAGLAEEDLSLARLAKDHTDAIAILAELGASPLSHQEAHSRRVADLTVYLRKHHGERDLAELGALVASSGPAW
jgi:hypothetical protein